MTDSSYQPTEEQIAQLPAPRQIPGPGPFNGGLWRAANVIGFILIEYLTGSRLVSIDAGGAEVLESGGPVILAGNHNHRFDGTAIVMGLPHSRRREFTVVSSSLMFRVWGLWPSRRMRIRGWFIMGLLAHAYGAVWVHGDGDRGTATIIRLSRLLERGESLMIFRLGGLPMVRTNGSTRSARYSSHSAPESPSSRRGWTVSSRCCGASASLGQRRTWSCATAPPLWWARTTTPLRYSFDCAQPSPLRQRP